MCRFLNVSSPSAVRRPSLSQTGNPTRNIVTTAQLLKEFMIASMEGRDQDDVVILAKRLRTTAGNFYLNFFKTNGRVISSRRLFSLSCVTKERAAYHIFPRVGRNRMAKDVEK